MKHTEFDTILVPGPNLTCSPRYCVVVTRSQTEFRIPLPSSSGSGAEQKAPQPQAVMCKAQKEIQNAEPFSTPSISLYFIRILICSWCVDKER